MQPQYILNLVVVVVVVFFREFVCFYDIMALPDAERWRGAPLNRLALLPDPLVIA